MVWSAVGMGLVARTAHSRLFSTVSIWMTRPSCTTSWTDPWRTRRKLRRTSAMTARIAGRGVGFGKPLRDPRGVARSVFASNSVDFISLFPSGASPYPHLSDEPETMRLQPPS